MGYYSDVRIAIYGEKEEVTKLLVEYSMAHNKDYTEHVKPAMNVVDIGSGDIALIFEFDGVKWYDDFIDVEPFNTLYSMAQDNTKLHGEYVRVGEDAADINEDCFGESRYIYSVSTAIVAELEISNNPSLLGMEV